MKMLILFLMIGCGKVGMKTLRVPDEKITSPYRQSYNKYEASIDVLVAFLWPQSISTPDQKRLVREIISLSRNLKNSKDEYFSERVKLERAFAVNHCQCTLNGLCEDAEIPGDEVLCKDIEKRTYENDAKLIPVMEMVEAVKAKVNEVGGEWLDSQSDLPEAGLSTFEVDQGRIFFSALGANRGVPESYEARDIKFSEQGKFVRVEFQIQSKRGGIYQFDLGMKDNPNSLTIQGDLLWIHDGVKRQGIIYWEQVLKDSTVSLQTK